MSSHFLDKYCKKIYICFVIFFVVFLTYIGLNFKTNSFSDIDDTSSMTLDKWQLFYDGVNLDSHDISNINIPKNKELIMKTKLPSILPLDYYLGFSTNHTNIFIYADGSLIYEFSLSNNSFGHSPGYGYHMVPQISRYVDKEIEVHLSSPYGLTILPEFELASVKTLFSRQIALSAVPFGIAIFTLILGLFILLYGMYTIIKANINKSFIFLGLFTITVAIYTANEQPIFLLITHNHIISSYLSFVTLMIMPVPFILFLKDMYTDNNHIAWYIVIITNFINILSTITLQILNIADFRETLFCTHIIFTITIIVTIILTIRELIKYRLTIAMKLNLICISVVALCLIATLVIYYKSERQAPIVLGNLGFLVYIVVVGIYTIKSNTQLLAKGRQAEKYRSLAYTDNLTGLKNRTSHDSRLSHANLLNHSFIIVMFDLNNLKYYNDNLGHEIGDKYIVTSAKIIKDAFGELSNDHCYRIGGDEFCAVIEDRTVDEYLVAYDKFCAEIDEFNKTSDVLKIQIATGYAEYNPSIDSDLKQTRSRADAMMYKDKFTMKQKMGTL